MDFQWNKTEAISICKCYHHKVFESISIVKFCKIHWEFFNSPCWDYKLSLNLFKCPNNSSQNWQNLCFKSIIDSANDLKTQIYLFRDNVLILHSCNAISVFFNLLKICFSVCKF